MRLLFLAALGAAFAFPAAAQEAGAAIDLTPLYEVLIAFVAAALTGALGLLGRWIHRTTGIEIDLKHNAILDEAIEWGVRQARFRLRTVSTLEVENEIARIAARYVFEGAPKAIRHFGLTPERVQKMIEAWLAPPARADPAG